MDGNKINRKVYEARPMKKTEEDRENMTKKIRKTTKTPRGKLQHIDDEEKWTTLEAFGNVFKI